MDRSGEQRLVPAQVTAPPPNPMAVKATRESLRSPGLLLWLPARSSELRESTSAIAARPEHDASRIEPLSRVDGAGQRSRCCCDDTQSQTSTAEFAMSARKRCAGRPERSSRPSRRAVTKRAARVCRQYQVDVRPV